MLANYLVSSQDYFQMHCVCFFEILIYQYHTCMHLDPLEMGELISGKR